ncbi:VOC family protein [Acidothermaceae bacterium B102]|nr:VOC family protein [Acidothermaceae bacterium B102]
MIGRLHTVVIDCPDPAALAAFYAELVGWPVVEHDEDWCVLDGGAGQRLAFQRSRQAAPPTWPDPATPQQLHLDIAVDDIELAEEQVLKLGARPLPGGEEDFRVYADPAGHPFCLEFSPV